MALIDCMMPEMDGFQLASIIKNSPELNKTKLVMLSSAAQVGDAEERKRFGLEAWLVKPVKQSELLTCLLTILGDTYEPKSAALPEDQKKIASSVHHKKAKILLAEDNAINRTFAIRLLEKAGHTVVSAENGQEVLDLMETEKFDLILMDVSMPEMDGYEATRRIRSAETRNQSSYSYNSHDSPRSHGGSGQVFGSGNGRLYFQAGQHQGTLPKDRYLCQRLS